MIKKVSVIFLVHVAFSLSAQNDTIYTQQYLDKSTRFAWLTYGGDLLFQSGGSTQLLNNGALQDIDFGASVIPRLTIGGVHFWGHVDFYVTFPLSFISYQDRPSTLSELDLLQGVETGLRLYPLKLEPNSIRPFAGISFRRIRYTQESEDSDFDQGTPDYGRMIHPLQLGLTYTTDKFHISASSYINYQNEFDYFISPTQTANVKLEPVSFNLSILRYVDSDRSMRSPKVVRRLNDDHRLLERENLLSTWYWGLGPSAALQVSKSPFLRENFPFFYDQYSAAILPDVAFGRYFHKPDLNVGLSYRTYGESYEGFDAQIDVRRHSVGIESVKFLFNWLGFVPFLGAAVSYENLRADVNGTTFSESKPALGIVFGWDIRVTRTGSSLLRTNLRYFPDLHLDIEGEKMMFDHLEFNFIQWVQFIGRKKAYQRNR